MPGILHIPSNIHCHSRAFFLRTSSKPIIRITIHRYIIFLWMKFHSNGSGVLKLSRAMFQKEDSVSHEKSPETNVPTTGPYSNSHTPHGIAGQDKRPLGFE